MLNAFAITPEFRVTPHFTVREMFLTDMLYDNMPPDDELINIFSNAYVLAENVLEPVRKEFGPTVIHSWYRSPRVNKAVGGARTSKHLIGAAADFHCQGGDIKEVTEWIIENLKFRTVILEPSWVHVDYIAHDLKGKALIKTEDGYKQYA